MKKSITSMFFLAASALLLAVPANAQSAFVLVIGELPRAEAQAPARVLTTEERIDEAVEDACPRPFIRDLKGWSLYHACAASARAEAELQVAGRDTAAEPVVALR